MRRKHALSVLVLSFMLFLGLGSVGGSGSNSSTSINSSSKSPPTRQRELPKWTTSTSRDKMTGEKTCYAASPVISATEPMGFPYGSVTAWLGVGTDGKDEWAYIGFSDAPNLSETETMDGYNLIRTRIKWDSEISHMTLTQDWGASFLHFQSDWTAIQKMADANNCLLELDWYGEGKTYFEFTLRGSSMALAKIRNECP